MVKSASSLLLEDTRITINKIREMLRDVDFSELEEKDKVNAIKTVASTVSMIPKLVKDLSEAEKAVTKEIEEQDKRVAGYAIDANKAVIIVVNKWDAVEKNDKSMQEWIKKIKSHFVLRAAKKSSLSSTST